MIRPVAFQFNEETAGSNHFQNKVDTSIDEIQKEFDSAVQKLKDVGISVVVFEDTLEPVKPDAVFPNNWIQLKRGEIVLFPMFAENRRMERRQDIIDQLSETFQVEAINDLSPYESQGKILEGTGSVVFDHYSMVGYASVSSRTDEILARAYIKESGYVAEVFNSSVDEKEIYHTNVIMAITEHVIIVCMDVINEEGIQAINRSGKLVMEISIEQMNAFAGNMLELNGLNEQSVLVMSQTAYDSLSIGQKDILENLHEICCLSIDQIEKIGGGSARCMIAENFLTRKL